MFPGESKKNNQIVRTSSKKGIGIPPAAVAPKLGWGGAVGT